MLDPALGRPDDVPDFRIRVVGDQAHLTWGAAGPAAAHYHLKFLAHGLTGGWTRAVDLATDVTGRNAIVPAVRGQYMIRGVAVTGLLSAEAAVVESNSAALDALNVVLSLPQHPTWAGTKGRGLGVVDNDLQLHPLVAFSSTYDFPAASDLGAVYTSRLTARLAGYGYSTTNTLASWPPLAQVGPLSGAAPDAATLILMMQTTRDDPAAAGAVWSDWRPFVIADYDARAFRFRLDLRTTAPSVAVRVTELTVSIDMPDRVEGGEDIECPAAGVRINFSPPFRARPAIAVDGQELPSGARSVRTEVSRAGFHQRFVDADGDGIECSFDWVAKGYGRAT